MAQVLGRLEYKMLVAVGRRLIIKLITNGTANYARKHQRNLYIYAKVNF